MSDLGSIYGTNVDGSNTLVIDFSNVNITGDLNANLSATSTLNNATILTNPLTEPLKYGSFIAKTSFSQNVTNTNWNTIKTVTVSGRNGGWSQIGCHVRYCSRNSSLGPTHGIGEAFRTLSEDGNQMFGSGSTFIRYNSHGNSDASHQFRALRINADSFGIQYRNSYSNISTAIMGTIEIQYAYAIVSIS